MRVGAIMLYKRTDSLIGEQVRVVNNTKDDDGMIMVRRLSDRSITWVYPDNLHPVEKGAS